MGHKVPWIIGMLICHHVTSRPLIVLQKEAVLSPCNFDNDRPFDSLHSEAWYLTWTSRAMQWRTLSQRPNQNPRLVSGKGCLSRTPSFRKEKQHKHKFYGPNLLWTFLPLTPVQRISPHLRRRRKTHFLVKTSTIFDADIHDPKGSRRTLFRKSLRWFFLVPIPERPSGRHFSNTVSESTVSNTKLSELFRPHWVSGRELSEFLSAYYLCAKANLPSLSHNSPSFLQHSVSSLFRNSTHETVPLEQKSLHTTFIVGELILQLRTHQIHNFRCEGTNLCNACVSLLSGYLASIVSEGDYTQQQCSGN